jgi:hypothetical protein
MHFFKVCIDGKIAGTWQNGFFFSVGARSRFLKAGQEQVVSISLHRRSEGLTCRSFEWDDQKTFKGVGGS